MPWVSLAGNREKKRVGKFEPGNTASKGFGRPVGTGWAAQMKAAIDTDRFKKIIEALCEQAEAGDVSATSLILSRMVPPVKPIQEPVKLGLPEGTLAEQAAALVKAVADGVVSPSDGKTCMDIIQAAAALGELQALEARITQLEAKRA